MLLVRNPTPGTIRWFQELEPWSTRGKYIIVGYYFYKNKIKYILHTAKRHESLLQIYVRIWTIQSTLLVCILQLWCPHIQSSNFQWTMPNMCIRCYYNQIVCFSPGWRWHQHRELVVIDQMTQVRYSLYSVDRVKINFMLKSYMHTVTRVGKGQHQNRTRKWWPLKGLPTLK